MVQYNIFGTSYHNWYIPIIGMYRVIIAPTNGSRMSVRSKQLRVRLSYRVF